jgi:hypothetical protein
LTAFIDISVSFFALETKFIFNHFSLFVNTELQIIHNLILLGSVTILFRLSKICNVPVVFWLSDDIDKLLFSKIRFIFFAGHEFIFVLIVIGSNQGILIRILSSHALKFGYK